MIVDIDAGDENADWIKLVRGGAPNRQELAIHDQLAANHFPSVSRESSQQKKKTAPDKSTQSS